MRFVPSCRVAFSGGLWTRPARRSCACSTATRSQISCSPAAHFAPCCPCQQGSWIHVGSLATCRPEAVLGRERATLQPLDKGFSAQPQYGTRWRRLSKRSTPKGAVSSRRVWFYPCSADAGERQEARSSPIRPAHQTKV